jgi:hypothetical protein
MKVLKYYSFTLKKDFKQRIEKDEEIHKFGWLRNEKVSSTKEQ